MLRALLACCLCARAWGLAGKLTEQTWAAQALQKDVNTVAMFFAPWCGHCKDLKPNYLELAQDYAGHKKVFVATVDCTESRPICVDNGVEGYPTIKYWIGGEPGATLVPLAHSSPMKLIRPWRHRQEGARLPHVRRGRLHRLARRVQGGGVRQAQEVCA
eukprot:COSAG03_NODE_336_length_8900_cov_32.176230_12_plen_159_part_00